MIKFKNRTIKLVHASNKSFREAFLNIRFIGSATKDTCYEVLLSLQLS